MTHRPQTRSCQKTGKEEKQGSEYFQLTFFFFLALKLFRLCDFCQWSQKLHHFGGLRCAYAEAADVSGRVMQRGREDQ